MNIDHLGKTVSSALRAYVHDLEYQLESDGDPMSSLELRPEYLNSCTCGTPEFNTYSEAIDYIAGVKSLNGAIEGHWFCEKTNDIDCDHGECVGYKIPELGITVFVYQRDDTRISIHRD
tara:strand:- start:215 stop:571 length:357 start_codon:yes stop_codon:yes gene_type:complete